MEAKSKQLRTVFWINAILIGIIFLITVLPKGPEFGNKIASNILVEQLSIIITLGGIPFALKLFQRKQQKIQSETLANAASQIALFYYLRMAIIDFLILINLIGFIFLETRNFIFMALIAIFVLFFCYSGYDLTILTEEKNNNINNDLEE